MSMFNATSMTPQQSYQQQQQIQHAQKQNIMGQYRVQQPQTLQSHQNTNQLNNQQYSYQQQQQQIQLQQQQQQQQFHNMQQQQNIKQSHLDQQQRNVNVKFAADDVEYVDDFEILNEQTAASDRFKRNNAFMQQIFSQFDASSFNLVNAIDESPENIEQLNAQVLELEGEIEALESKLNE